MTAPAENSPSPRTRGWVRLIVEMAVSLAVLVVLFRAFLASGYMIETGSMAPCLLGHHRPVVCPACRYRFAVEDGRSSAKAVCPNCGRGAIALEGLPRNDGDHLLVHRSAFALRPPRRWEVVVFRNPNKPTQAYVKRVVALPGESLQIIDGDVYIGGKIQAKNLAAQRGIRILIYDHDFRPPDDDPDWQPRWAADSESAGWQAEGGRFRFEPAEASRSRTAGETEWVSYRHWVRRGGTHATKVPLARWPEKVPRPKDGFGPLSYDAAAAALTCKGALPRSTRDELLAETADRSFHEALEKLYDASHLAPITDECGYNRGRDGTGRNEVRDLALSAEVALHEGAGQFLLAIDDGAQEFQCQFDVPERRIRLIEVRTGKALRSGTLPAAMLARPATIEFSLMDRQALVAVDGEPVFEPLAYAAPRGRGPTPWRPVRFGARNLRVDVSALRLYRDVYYTTDEGRRGIDAPLTLGPDEYFVLGDNSPVSKDSRSWREGTRLSSDMLLGKPLLVHLPSRRSRLQIGRWETEIRIPEPSRIRYIR